MCGKQILGSDPREMLQLNILYLN